MELIAAKPHDAAGKLKRRQRKRLRRLLVWDYTCKEIAASL